MLNVTRVRVAQNSTLDDPGSSATKLLRDVDQTNISRADGKKEIPQSASDRFNVFLSGQYLTHAMSRCTFIARKITFNT